MSDVKHTPLPFLVRENSVDGSTDFDVVAHDGDDDPWIVAMVMKDANPDCSGKANAEFIVRACNNHYDLLEALKVCASIIHLQNGNLHQDTNAILLLAKAAVDKAEGRT